MPPPADAVLFYSKSKDDDARYLSNFAPASFLIDDDFAVPALRGHTAPHVEAAFQASKIVVAGGERVRHALELLRSDFQAAEAKRRVRRQRRLSTCGARVRRQALGGRGAHGHAAAAAVPRGIGRTVPSAASPQRAAGFVALPLRVIGRAVGVGRSLSERWRCLARTERAGSHAGRSGDDVGGARPLRPDNKKETGRREAATIDIRVLRLHS